MYHLAVATCQDAVIFRHNISFSTWFVFLIPYSIILTKTNPNLTKNIEKNLNFNFYSMHIMYNVSVGITKC